MPSKSFEFDIQHNGKHYAVEVDVELEMQDDSFDHAFGTQKCFSCSAGEWGGSVFEINETGEEEVDLDSIEGLESAIQYEINEALIDLDASDYFDKYGRDSEYYL